MNYGFGKIEAGSPIIMEYMMLDRSLINEESHNMAE